MFSGSRAVALDIVHAVLKTGFEEPTAAGSVCVDAAARRFPDFTNERDTPRICLIRPVHRILVRRSLMAQAFRHRMTFSQHLGVMKRNSVGVATGAASLTRMELRRVLNHRSP